MLFSDRTLALHAQNLVPNPQYNNKIKQCTQECSQQHRPTLSQHV